MQANRSIDIRTTDGMVLSGTLLEGSAGGPAVLLSSAAAVEKRFYVSFARALVEGGAGAVLTYDYRGVGDSMLPAGRRARMKEWGTFDFPAALAALETLIPGRPVVGIGHSFGGLAVGLSGLSERFSRYAMVASLNGYIRRTAEPFTVFARMHLLGVPISHLFGRIPKGFGLGTSLPGPIFRDWARWCLRPDFFFGDPGVPESARFAEVRLPLLSVGIRDDRWGTPRAVSALNRHFANAELYEWWLPGIDADRTIGHLGFFRRGNSDLWPELIGYLLEGPLPADARRGRARRPS